MTTLRGFTSSLVGSCFLVYIDAKVGFCSTGEGKWVHDKNMSVLLDATSSLIGICLLVYLLDPDVVLFEGGVHVGQEETGKGKSRNGHPSGFYRAAPYLLVLLGLGVSLWSMLSFGVFRHGGFIPGR